MAITDGRARAILEGRDVGALLSLIADPQVDEGQRPHVVVSALDRLESLSYAQLPALVVRVCVESPEETAWDVRHLFLSGWIRGEGYHNRPEVIADVTERLRHADDKQLVAAIRTAWVIGYRDDRLQSELARIAGLNGQRHPDHEAEGHALAALSGMGYPDSESITRVLQSRLDEMGAMTGPDCWTAMQAATPSMIPFLCAAAASELVAVHALLELPARHPRALPEIWEAFRSLDESTRFMYVSSAVKRVDLEDVGDYVVSRALLASQGTENRNLFMSTNLTLLANLPSHMRVLSKARDSLSADAISSLKSSAVTPSGDRVRSHNLETRNKEAAWNLILRLGLRAAREWLPQAMVGEVNFTLAELAEIAGFLQISEAVDPLAKVVRDESFDIGIGITCLRGLGVIGTDQALGALLESQVWIRHGEERLIPRDLVHALGSVCMAQHKCDAVWQIVGDSSADKRLREACAYVIEDLADFIDAPLPSTEAIVGLIRAQGRGMPGYEQLISSLSRFSDSVEAKALLRELGESDYDSPLLVRALAHAGLLNEFPSRIEQMGFKHANEGWVIGDPLDETAAFALLFLYRNDESFEPAMQEVLASETVQPAIQIVGNLRSTDHLSENILEALLKRALRRNGPNSSDRSILEALSRTWPDVLTEPSTISEVSRWCVSARRAYLASLRTALAERGNASAIAQVACEFLSDEDRGVRRDAARIARSSNPAELQKAVDELASRQDELDQAVFMLEAAFWLQDGWSLYEGRGSSHREPLVRELAKGLGLERRASLLARNYLPVVLGSRDYLDTWCYGQALLELGDEETIEGLYAGLPSEVYRRAYLVWLAKELEKRLETRRRDQSEKLTLPPPDSSEEPIKAFIEFEHQRLGPFAGVLQVSQTRSPRRWLSSWSVRIEDEPDLASRLSTWDGDAPIFIETSGRHRGQVLPIRTEFNTGSDGPVAQVLLLGQGDLKSA